MEVLEKRLRDRGTENEESLAKRLGAAAAGIHCLIVCLRKELYQYGI